MELYNITKKDIYNNLINLNQIVFEMTDACNLRCSYCIYSGIYKGLNNLSNNHLTFNKAKLLLDYLIDIWDRNNRPISSKPIFVGFYGGEPLLNISVVKEIVRYVEENIANKFKVIFSMTSNAILLDKHMDYLAEKDFQLLISLDGDNDCSLFRKTISGKESFPIVYKNVKQLEEKYPSYFKHHVNFNSVYNQKTSFNKLHEFFNTNFKKTPFISQINDTNVADDKIDEFKLMFADKIKDFMEESDRNELDFKLFLSSPRVSLLTKFIFKHTGNIYPTYNDLFVNKKLTKIIPTGTCTPFQKKMFITARGNILQCEKISHKYTLGYISDSEVNLNIDKIASDFNNLVQAFIKQCETCSVNYNCAICILQKYSTVVTKTCDKYYTAQRYSDYINKNLEFLKENPRLLKKILNEVSLH